MSNNQFTFRMFANPTRSTELVTVEEALGIPLSANGAPVLIERYKEPGELTPAMPANWVPDRKVIMSILASWNTGVPLQFVGAPGAGKSEGLEHFFAALNMDAMIVQMSDETTVADLLGEKDLVDGDKGTVTKHTLGPIPEAFVRNIPIVMNEWDYLRPGVQAEGQTFVRSSYVQLKQFGGRMVHRGPDVRFFSTMNTRGFGDMAGNHTGAMAQNTAALQRWMVEVVEYPEESVELDILKRNAPFLDESLLQRIVRFAALMRTAYTNGDVPMPFGVRSTVDAAKIIGFYQDIREGFRKTLLNRLEDPSHLEVVTKAFRDAFGEAF